MAAAQAGKHILLQKPMAFTLADCDAIIAAVRHYGVKFSLGKPVSVMAAWTPTRHPDALAGAVKLSLSRLSCDLVRGICRRHSCLPKGVTVIVSGLKIVLGSDNHANDHAEGARLPCD